MKMLVLTALVCANAMGTTITYAGADTVNGARWRTTSVIKPLDIDGDNRYGTDGYVFLASPSGTTVNLPGYVLNLQRMTQFEYYGGNLSSTLYVPIDNLSGTGTVYPGTWYSASGSIDVFARFVVRSNATFRLGVLVDMQDYADVSPLTLRVDQIFSANPADSGFVSAILEPNRDADWYFFDITADAGDTFHISGQNWNAGVPPSPFLVNGIGAITFDSIPEPSSFGFMAIGLGAMLHQFRRKFKR